MRAAFDSAKAFTIGIEEELMLLDPLTFDLAPRARELLARTGHDERFKLELPAAQLELLTPPRSRVGDAIADLRAGREALVRAAGDVLRVAAAGVHPTAAPEGELNPGERYDTLADRFGRIARRQLVFALQIHIAPGDAERGLAVYNGLRSYLPEIAALAANAPFYEGADTGLASVRPKIAELLPRQGVPPPLATWEEYERALRWGAKADAVPDAGAWWWELRPHPRFGTLELRVADAQTTVGEAAAVSAFAQCLVGWLGERFDRGGKLVPAPTWRIEENRWAAARSGVEGEFADLLTGERRATRARLMMLIDELAPVAERLDCASELAAAKGLVSVNGALRQREVVTANGIDHLAGWLAERFLA
jgi:glutamate---cysteine ligase / carboxylate-amine ligase